IIERYYTSFFCHNKCDTLKGNKQIRVGVVYMSETSKSEARENRILVNSEIEVHGKKPLIAYLLWFFLGNFGGHRFYFGKIGTASLQLFLAVAGYLTVWFFLGFIFLIPLWIW